ncbi:MAG: DnaA regulatory inactivator Hda [Betaproteobacteria bacterium]|nr:DnaA regulatory inactivator Hda [Betaproteobacteria bacterium]
MRQLTLNLRPQAAQHFENFIVGDNAEAVAAVRLLATFGLPASVYLWGEPGCGRSHLLHSAYAESLAGGRPAAFASAIADGEDFPLPQQGLLCVEYAEQLDDAGQAALFRAFIRAHEQNTALLISGSHPPAQLSLREDVRTRLGQSLVFQLKPLDDRQKEDVLTLYGLARGVFLEPDLIQYLLRHGRRDLPWLLAMIDTLDEDSLARHRVPTLPLLREVMQGAADEQVLSPNRG